MNPVTYISVKIKESNLILDGLLQVNGYKWSDVSMDAGIYFLDDNVSSLTFNNRVELTSYLEFSAQYTGDPR